MHRSFIVPFLLIIAAPASAQLAGGVMGGVDGKVGSIPAGVPGSATTAVPNPATGAKGVTKSADRVTATAGRAATSVVDRKAVHINAETSVRDTQGSICDHRDYYNDPVYRNGQYHCEPNEPKATTSVKVREPR